MCTEHVLMQERILSKLFSRKGEPLGPSYRHICGSSLSWLLYEQFGDVPGQGWVTLASATNWIRQGFSWPCCWHMVVIVKWIERDSACKGSAKPAPPFLPLCLLYIQKISCKPAPGPEKPSPMRVDAWLLNQCWTVNFRWWRWVDTRWDWERVIDMNFMRLTIKWIG